ncbi:MAG: cysteine hydrolase [Treponema sp.]|uniref:cysteine hydrolase family protein n=1 Tax=Treponema sp. TaxID=166 RepID=UPI00257F0930|nr:cysteine hydrolase family protein [Treponema sp.]MBQ5536296.1 cysteine hydrolase [Treponema sp.]
MKDMVLLVIDTQKGITDARLFAFEKIRDNIRTLIEKARESGVEVVFVQHDDGEGSGFSVGDKDFEIFEEFRPNDGEKVFVKKVNSALHKSVGLSDYLSGKGVKKIVAVGLQTNFCIDATIHTGFDLGFEMLVPAYANSTFDSEYMSAETAYRYYNEFLWNGRFAKCIPMDDAVRLLEERRK